MYACCMLNILIFSLNQEMRMDQLKVITIKGEPDIFTAAERCNASPGPTSCLNTSVK